MAVSGAPLERTARPAPSFAYLMTGAAIACICVSGIVGSIFTPNLVTGTQHQHIPIGALSGWIFDLIAIGLVLKVALHGIRAGVTDKAPWTLLGLGVSAIWLAVMFVAIFAPVWITGTDPTRIPVWAGLSAIAGVILTAILCNFVNTASFVAESQAGSAPTTPTTDRKPGADVVTVTLRQLAQLHDSGVITDAEFQAKKNDLLSRI